MCRAWVLLFGFDRMVSITGFSQKKAGRFSEAGGLQEVRRQCPVVVRWTRKPSMIMSLFM